MGDDASEPVTPPPAAAATPDEDTHLTPQASAASGAAPVEATQTVEPEAVASRSTVEKPSEQLAAAQATQPVPEPQWSQTRAVAPALPEPAAAIEDARLGELQAEVERLRREVAEVGASKAELAAHVATLSSAREDLEAQVGSLRTQLEAATAAHGEGSGQVAALQAEVEELRELQRKTKEVRPGVRGYVPGGVLQRAEQGSPDCGGVAAHG